MPRCPQTIKTPAEPALLPCPFCGSEGYVGQWVMSSYWSVGCRSTTECVDWLCRFETRAKAVEHWNRREPSSPTLSTINP